MAMPSYAILKGRSDRAESWVCAVDDFAGRGNRTIGGGASDMLIDRKMGVDGRPPSEGSSGANGFLGEAAPWVHA